MVGNDAVNYWDLLGLIYKRLGGHHIVAWESWKLVCGAASENTWRMLFDVGDGVMNINLVPGQKHDATAHHYYNRRVAQLISEFFKLMGLDCSCLDAASAEKLRRFIRYTADPYVRGFLDEVHLGPKALKKWADGPGAKIKAVNEALIKKFGHGTVVRWIRKAGKRIPIVQVGSFVVTVSATGSIVKAAESELKDGLYYDEIMTAGNAVAEIPFDIGRGIAENNPGFSLDMQKTNAGLPDDFEVQGNSF